MAAFNTVKSKIQSLITAANRKTRKRDTDLTGAVQSLLDGFGGGGGGVYGVIREYKVNAGAEVYAGDFVEFVNKFASGEFSVRTSLYMSACKLDNTRVLLTYQDKSNSFQGKAVVLTMSGADITLGETITFESEGAHHIASTLLSENRVLVVYAIADFNKAGRARILTINGTSISVGAFTKFDETASLLAVSRMSDRHFLAEYRNDYKMFGEATALTIDGDTITASNAIQLGGTSSTAGITTTNLSNGKSLAVFSSILPYARVFSMDGTTLVAGSETAIPGRDVRSASAVKLTDNKVLLAYSDGGTDSSRHGKAIILTVTGTTVSYGANIVFNAAETLPISAVALSESQVLVTYNDKSNSGRGTAILLSVEGTTITAGSKVVFADGNTTDISVCAFSSGSVLVAYSDNGVSMYKSLNINNDSITVVNEAETKGTFVQTATSNHHNVGVAKMGGAEGETIEVYCAV